MFPEPMNELLFPKTKPKNKATPIELVATGSFNILGI